MCPEHFLENQKSDGTALETQKKLLIHSIFSMIPSIAVVLSILKARRGKFRNVVEPLKMPVWKDAR